ncbi:DUF5313 family protein [Streptosporangium roseum]|uniref:Uncharacterized protein n=1 Tax=Streptosporangium roseum (strain ATCC 12428 / DSM 43021 / JCM 3005 / KCTC 9067 / NCIMB 10171 / NRRL 2505 / NI 9100) TaxID=479432 RepID=D2B614_STRRD|nr:DUF5313 family protein [Streptosporangium roseum]ACZ83727.1 hypothetical protein Sros_0704 [Streptosporangium roseum DSM 43021]
MTGRKRLTAERRSDAYADRCHLLLRVAYPPRFMQARGEEFLSTLLDLAEPGRTRPDLRTVLDVVRASVVWRLREHPPLWRWLCYRLFGKRLPFRYRWWVRDDVLGRFFLVRLLGAWLSLVFLPFTLTDVFRLMGEPGSWGIKIGWLLGTCLTAFTSRRQIRRDLLAKHQFTPNGTPLTPQSDEGMPR